MLMNMFYGVVGRLRSALVIRSSVEA